MNDTDWMEQAYQQACLAEQQGEIPVGAVVVSPTQGLLSQAHNRIILDNDPTAHAEVLALRLAAQTIDNYRLTETTLYVTLEPCCMCAGALVQARVKRVVFATRDFKAGAAGSVYNLLQGYPLNHKIIIDEGIMQQPCAKLLVDFFKNRRSDASPNDLK